ncbi:unnamed protein product [Withania somnifera]
MIPTYTNSSSSPPSFPFELNNRDLSSSIYVNPYNNNQFASSSSNSLSCTQTFFNISTTNIEDRRDYNYHQSQFHHQQQQQHHEVDNFVSSSRSHDHVEKKKKGLKLTLWKKGDQKMKNMKLEDQKQQIIETHAHSNNSSSNNNNNNIPIRVCSDCSTTKTPLWRSGPKGPKSLCNACGIRQRKARRAMAVANGTNVSSTSSSTTTPTKLKVQQHKHKTTKLNTNHVVPFKKRCKFLSNSTITTPATAAAPCVDSSSSSYNNNNNNAQQKKKLCFEDLFVNLSNNLAIHCVFPQDEKEAAILLMALSSDLVHG